MKKRLESPSNEENPLKTDPDFEVGFGFAINHFGDPGFSPDNPSEHLSRPITPQIRKGWNAALAVAHKGNNME